jgi:hypothetical protein
MAASNYIPAVQAKRRQSRAHRVSDNVHRFDAPHRDERLMELIAHAVRRGDDDSGYGGDEGDAASPPAGDRSHEQRAETRVEQGVRIFDATPSPKFGVWAIDDSAKINAM